MNVAFDVDGTLQSADDELRPHTIFVFEELIKMDHSIYIWSGGGVDYIERFINRNNLHKYVKGKIPKGAKLNRYFDAVVDDSKDVVNIYKELGKISFKVSFYDNNENDRELLDFR